MKSIAILGGSTLGEGPWRPGRKVWSIAIFGSSTIDFTQAEMQETVTEVVTLSFFGANKIIVPDDMPVAVSGIVMLGGKSVKRPHARRVTEASPYKLHVKAFGLVGGFSATERKPEAEMDDILDD